MDSRSNISNKQLKIIILIITANISINVSEIPGYVCSIWVTGKMLMAWHKRCRKKH